MALHVSLVSSSEWLLAEVPQPLHVGRLTLFLVDDHFCSIRGHVLSEDTYYRTITDDQILITRRLLTKTNKIPRWGERIFSRGSAAAMAFVVEESICDLKRRLFTTTTVNINMKSLMVRKSLPSLNNSRYSRFQTVEETCVYRPDGNDASRTMCEKKVVAHGELFGFKTTLETFAIQRYKKNQELASLGLEFILHKLYLPQLPPPPIKGLKVPDTRPLSSQLTDRTKNLFQSSANDKL